MMAMLCISNPSLSSWLRLWRAATTKAAQKPKTFPLADSPRQARHLKADILLCDYAEEVNGKLYVMGGGWSRLFTPNQPSNMALAIKLTIPWNEANRLREIAVRLLTEDNNPVPNEHGQDI